LLYQQTEIEFNVELTNATISQKPLVRTFVQPRMSLLINWYMGAVIRVARSVGLYIGKQRLSLHSQPCTIHSPVIMENLAYLYVLAEEGVLAEEDVLAEEAALPETNLRRSAESIEDHPSCVFHRASQRRQAREGGKAALEGDRSQPVYPTFYL
jgi:hypothetical protein